MKILILQLIVLVVLFKTAKLIPIKNVHYVYKGISKLGLVNKKVIIECPISAQFYLWKFYHYQSEPQVLLEQEGKNLTIESATLDRSGIYECKSTTGFVNTDTNITVKIIDPQSEIVREICALSMSSKTQDIMKGLCFHNDKVSRTLQPKIGEDTELDCTAVGTDLKYYWNFIDENGMKNPLQTGFNISKVIIKSAMPENQGSYRCDVTDKDSQRISMLFKVMVTESTTDVNMEIVGEKQDDITAAAGQKVKLNCEVKNNFDRIYSVKWGKRIKSPVPDLVSKPNIVSWDQYTYKLLPASEETIVNSHHTLSSLLLTQLESDHSGIYTCLAMDSRGRTVHKVFNVTVSRGHTSPESNNKRYFFLLYILLPIILICICICFIVYYCIKTSSKKTNTSSLPLKKYANPNNTNKESMPNYYYPVNNNRPPLPQPNESQASLVSPNTLTSYTSYGNYQMQSTNQPSCCSSNGV